MLKVFSYFYIEIIKLYIYHKNLAFLNFTSTTFIQSKKDFKCFTKQKF